MPRYSILSTLSIASLLSSSLAFPLQVQQRNALNARKAQISVVNVDGSSNPTATSYQLPETVTQTITSNSAPTVIATVNVDRGTATETLFVTVTPTATPDSLPPTVPFAAPPFPPSNATSTTLLSPGVPLSTGTPSEPCDEDAGDGAPFHTYYPAPVGTGTVGYHAAYPTGVSPTGGYNAGVIRPSGMTAPFPSLPIQTPYWFNSTDIPAYRRRAIVS